MGTGGGFMWLSMDRGERWTPLFYRQLTLRIEGPSAIVIDPNNTNLIYLD